MRRSSKASESHRKHQVKQRKSDWGPRLSLARHRSGRLLAAVQLALVEAAACGMLWRGPALESETRPPLVRVVIMGLTRKGKTRGVPSRPRETSENA
jgi:hypothetical protein